MKLDIKKIAVAWAKSLNPSTSELILAEKRLEVCNSCDMSSKNLINVTTCSACGCPLSKKVFTSDYNDCPLDKWEEVDNKYFDLSTIKTKKSII